MHLLCAVILFILSSSLWAAAPANSVTITDLGTGQTDRVFVISRVFAKGEIRGYPKPQISGVDVSEWQSDNKTTWDDGSVAHSIISIKESLTVSQSKTITFVSSQNRCHLGSSSTCDAAALDEAGMLAFNSSNWDFEFEVSADPIGATTPESITARTIIDAGNFEYWQRGPVNTTVLAGRVVRTWDFAWDCSANCTGTMSTATWNNGSNLTLHPWFILSFYDGASGVRGQYILENIWTDALQDQRYDIVLKSGGSLSTSEFSKSDVVQYARSRWRKEYWSGTAPAGYDESDGQGGRLGYTLDLNLPYIVYSKVIPRMDLDRTVNDAGIDADSTSSTGSCYTHEPLMISNCAGAKSGAYVLGFGAGGGRPEIGLFPRFFLNYLYHPTDDAYRNLMRQADISGLPPAHFREASTSKLYEDLDNNGTADGELAFGRPISVNSRPTMNSVDTSDGNVGDRVTVLESWGSNGWGIDQAHQSAFATIPYLVTGNYYFLEEIQFWMSLNLTWGEHTNIGLTFGRHASWGAGGWTQTREQAWSYFRAGAHAAFFSPDDTPEKRYYTQKLTDYIKIMEGVLDIRDGIGYEAASTSPYNPNTDASRWHWGRHLKGMDVYQQLPVIVRWILCSALPGDAVVDNNKAFVCDSWFMTHYNRVAIHHVAELGFPADALARRLDQAFLNWIYDPNFSIYYTEAYNYPLGQQQDDADPDCSAPTLSSGITGSATSITVSCVPWYMESQFVPYVIWFDSWNGERVRICSVSGATLTACSGTQGLGRGWAGTSQTAQTAGDVILRWPPYTTLATMADSWISSFQSDTSWNSSDYFMMVRGTSSWLTANGVTMNGFSGIPAHQDLVDSMNASHPESDMNNDPKWAFKPRWEPARVLGVEAGDTFAIIRYVKPTAEDACTYDGVSDGITNSRYVEFIKTSLTAETPYSHTIVCSKDPYGDTPVSFTTVAALSGTTDFPVKVGSGSATVFVDHGATSSLGSEESDSCASGCTITLSGINRGLYYYRVRRSTGETGATKAVVIR